MASIQKLQIQGIRSYDPFTPMAVEFYKPLTIIVGQNGSGKTTIIECLRAACTGELPPNCRQGRAFLHDPKIVGEFEVKAQIRIKFTNVNGNDCVVSRSYQLSSRGQTTSFKSLEGSIEIWNKTTRAMESLSHRCADMNQIVPQLLGVSKPILDHVIFCHQDDSLWPMADDSTLKKKFDDIFAATKYTQALKSISDHKRDIVHKLEVLNEEVKLCKHQRDQGTALRLNIEEKNKRIAKLDETLEHLNQQLMSLQQQLDEMTNKELEVHEAVDTKAKLERELAVWTKELEHIQSAMSSRIQERGASLDRLEAKAKEELSRWDDERLEIDGAIDHCRLEVAQLQKKKDAAQEGLGRLRHAHQAHRRSVEERDGLVFKLASVHSLPVSLPAQGTPLGESLVAEFARALDEQLRAVRRGLDRARQQHQQRVDDVQERLNQKRAEEGILSETISTCKSELQATQAKLATAQARMQQSNRDSQRLAAAQARLKETKEQLQARQDSTAMADRKREADECERRLRVLQAELKVVIKDMSEATDTDKNQVLLAEKETQLGRRQARLDELLNDHRDSIAGVLQCRPEQVEGEDLDVEIAERQQEVQANLESAQAQAQRLQGEIKVVSASVEKADKDLAVVARAQSKAMGEMKRRLQRLSQATKHACAEAGVDPARADKSPAILRAVEDKINGLEQMGGMKVHYEACLPDMMHQAKLDPSHLCPLCTRACDTAELRQLEDNVQTILAEIRRSRKEAESIDQLKADADLLREIVRAWEQFQIKATTHTQLETDLASAQQKLVTLQPAANDAEALLKEATALHQAHATAHEHAKEIRRLHDECGEYGRDVSHLKMVISQTMGGAKSMKELVGEKEKLDGDIEDAQRALARAQREFNRERDQLGVLRQQVNEAQESVHSLKDSSQAVHALTTTIAELEDTQKSLSAKIENTAAKLRVTKADAEQLEAERQAVVEQGRQDDRQQSQQADLLARDAQSLNDTNARLSKLAQEQGSDGRLKDTERELERVDAEIKAANDRLNDQQEQRRLFDSNISGPRNVLANIAKNREFNKAEGEWKRVGKQLEDVRAHLQRALGAEAVEELRRKKNELRAEEIRLGGEKGEKAGERNAISGERKRLEGEMKSNNLEQAEARYRSKVVQLKTTQMAKDDLMLYHKALDEALMRYHSAKMEEINKVICDLWQVTYKGSDIDTIEIVSDHATERSRTYNYRVVMKKGNTSLDMRGRCSAGQRVLASLVIRLALSETFCLNCGILALDEPTTNLDRDNIESLAQALVGIIESRKRQSNFQLIIITHDEEFVNMLARHHVARFYMRVHKAIPPGGDSGRLVSVVDRQNIEAIFG